MAAHTRSSSHDTRHTRPARLLSRLRRRAGPGFLGLVAVLLWSTTASAQLDPLLFIKRVPPTVIIVMDTSLQMLEDGNGNFYDPGTYSTTADPLVMPAFSNIVPSSTAWYKRVFRGMTYEATPGRYVANTIVASPATGLPAADASFMDPTRWAIMRQGIVAAVSENKNSARWGLIRLRQKGAVWRTTPGCDKPVRVNDVVQSSSYGDTIPCNAGGVGKFAVYAPTVSEASYAQPSKPTGTEMVRPTDPNPGSMVIDRASRGVGDNSGLGIIPAGLGDVGFNDRPIHYALVDANKAASDAMNADTAANRACRNTVVILITGGKDDGDATYNSGHDLATTAAAFRAVTGGGMTRPVPIHVIGVKPAAADEAEMQSIATASRGRYTKATNAAGVAAAINYAVQSGFARSADFNLSQATEYLPVSPIVGTVNLENASDSNGNSLPNTEIVSSSSAGSTELPQRSNVLITAGFALPGFDGRLRAYRAYKPVADSTKPSGWKFVNDSTALWPDLDGRPALKGLARPPSDPNSRNIYTFIPNAAGGGSVVAFTTANVGLLSPHMGVGTNTSTLISLVRAQPLGAIIGSTPALMDAPSLDPPPDTDYGRSDGTGTFAGKYKDRRSLIFVGANDGMIHAIDARTGYEVWAFIPYNLLPKLRALSDGQPVEQFDYFVDSSPKLAEVKIKGEWRSLMMFGQGQGGTFYQAFDVTEAGMGIAPDQDGMSAVTSLLTQFDTPNESIVFKWAFPNYSHFDPTYTATFTVTDATPGGRVKVFGDLSAAATYAEKTVGFSWSDPAVGPLDINRSINAVIVGSGYFPNIEASIPNRGPSAPKAGNVMYLINADTGELVGNPSGSACSGTGCISVGDIATNGRKNALQADPTAAGDNGSFVVNKAFLGDIDGRYWRFTFTDTGATTKTEMVPTGQPIYSSSALLFVGSTDVYMFFSTGSDLLPVTAPGGADKFRLYGLMNGLGLATTMFMRPLNYVTNSGDFTIERPSTAPSVAGDIVFFATTNESSSVPCNDFTANLYAVTYTGSAAYDSDGNGKLDNNENPIAKTVAGRATAPFIVDQHLYLSTSGPGGAAVEKFGDPEDFNNGVGQVGVRILSWREIR